jgi:TetR/AcrR family transcriptional repressor of nem operon
MKDAGLTHGGFYGHFSSKEALMGEACDRALANSVAKWDKLCASGDTKALSAIVKYYLSTRHRDDLGGGCAVVALGAEVSRHGPNVRKATSDGVRSLVDVLARVVPGKTRAAKRKRALATFATMVGAIVLARAVLSDAELSEEILKAASASIGATTT